MAISRALICELSDVRAVSWISCFGITNILKGQSHEKVCEIIIWDVSFGVNYYSPTVFKIFKLPV
jgi:hypothetical protein